MGSDDDDHDDGKQKNNNNALKIKKMNNKFEETC